MPQAKPFDSVVVCVLGPVETDPHVAVLIGEKEQGAIHKAHVLVARVLEAPQRTRMQLQAASQMH